MKQYRRFIESGLVGEGQVPVPVTKDEAAR
jgi:hypothetical protein